MTRALTADATFGTLALPSGPWSAPTPATR